MTDTDKLKQEELEQLNKITVEAEEVGLEDLIVMGEAKKIPVHLTYPNTDGTTSKAILYVKQLTLKEIEKVKINNNKITGAMLNRKILNMGLFKSTGEKFTSEELGYLPIGVVNAIAEKILELSGVDLDKQNQLKDF